MKGGKGGRRKKSVPNIHASWTFAKYLCDVVGLESIDRQAFNGNRCTIETIL